jgi:exodeoxyribonuclease VII small subunit
MAAQNDNPANDVSALSFEQAMKELEDIVRRLESGQVKLDEAVSAYERGAALRKHCEEKLTEARTKVEKITGSGKNLGLEPMDRE